MSKYALEGLLIFIICLGLSFHTVILRGLQDRVTSLETQAKALKDIQDGVDIHLQFVDGDHKRLEDEIIGLRRDLDETRFLNQPAACDLPTHSQKHSR